MEELASVINNFARLILYAGGGVFTIAVCVAGFFYMTAFGDPQKQNIARGALVGAFVGVCIMGISFLAPRIMSQFVLEPAGLEGVANAGNTGCDRTLRSALITQRGVGNAQQVNQIVRAIQAQRAPIAMRKSGTRSPISRERLRADQRSRATASPLLVR